METFTQQCRKANPKGLRIKKLNIISIALVLKADCLRKELGANVKFVCKKEAFKPMDRSLAIYLQTQLAFVSLKK